MAMREFLGNDDLLEGLRMSAHVLQVLFAHSRGLL